ncbi:hypothetical protein ACLKA6_019097 [Drosophila palustris]
MAKRFQSITKSNKKFKLDVSVNASHFCTNSSNVADFWGSDDDDFILLATQLEEQNQRPPDDDAVGSRHKDDILSFSQFLPSTNDNASTQQQFEEPMTTTSRQCPVPTSQQPPGRAPGKPDAQTDIEMDGIEQWTDYSMPSGQATANRRQLAQERQLKFLMERVDVLKKENTKLQKEIIEHNNQTVTKEGEVSLLRNELRQARKLLQASKMDKIVMAEEAEKDCNQKVAEVFKQVIAKNAELSFTNVEFSEHKIRSTQNTLKENLLATTSVPDADECRNMLRLENLCIIDSYAKHNSTNNTDKHFYEYSKETRSQKKQRSFFEVELEHLLFHYAQLQSRNRPSTDKAIMDRLIMSVCGVFIEFWSYAQSLELPQHCMMYSYQHFNLQMDTSAHMRKSLSLIQPDAMYKLERAVLLRRYIATLALICQRQGSISQALLEKMYGNYSILQIAIEAITKVSYSFEVCEHFGVIEATASLLHSLLDHVNASKVSLGGSQQDLLFNLLKQLVFTRPSPWVFRELSICMLLCARQDQLMARMCIGSTNNCFVSDRVRSLYRFGPDSCLIQVYAGLLELCFWNDMPLELCHFELLLSICENHVRFVYQCFTSMPHFILKMLPLPSMADEDYTDKEHIVSKVVRLQSDSITNNHNTNATVNTSTNTSEFTSILAPDQAPQDHACECYVKLCLSFVTLVFQMMYQWTLQETKAHVSKVSEISQIAVHLLILIFKEYYLPNLFRDSEETTKHNLFLLCTWWQDHRRILNFEETHVHFLKQLQELQFMLKPLHQEANHSNPENDLAEWTCIVNNADANIQKYDSPDVPFNSNSLLTHKMNEFFNSLKTTANNFE